MVAHNIMEKTEYWIYNDSIELPTIIMIHGLRGTHHGLDLIAKPLSKYKVIVPDLPGFGATKPFSENHSLENYVKWLRKFIVGLNLKEPPILLGHSFGSIIAASYAKQYPKTIKKLILINPIGAPALKGPKQIFSQLATIYYWLGDKLPEPLGEKLLAAKPIVMLTSIKLAKTHDKKLRKFIHGQHLKYFSTYANRKVLNEAFITSIKNNVRDTARNITVPTLIIAGELDDITSLKDQYKLVKLFPNAEIVVINKVGHLTQYETPNEVTDAIKKFTN